MHVQGELPPELPEAAEQRVPDDEGHMNSPGFVAHKASNKPDAYDDYDAFDKANDVNDINNNQVHINISLV